MRIRKKRISFEINKEFLEIIDDIALLTKNKRPIILEAVIVNGILSYIHFLEKTWKDYLKEYKDQRIKREIRNLLGGLKKIKSDHKWLNPNYYKDFLSKEKRKKDKNRIKKVLEHMNLISET